MLGDPIPALLVAASGLLTGNKRWWFGGGRNHQLIQNLFLEPRRGNNADQWKAREM
jgi:hypothetical protein